MAREFDIYLGNRIHQCDLIIKNLMYRDTLSVTDRIVLECCLESYLLRKFVAVQTGSALGTHIDEMIKTCYERLCDDTTISAAVDFTAKYFARPWLNQIQIDASIAGHTAAMFAGAESHILIGVQPIEAHVKKAGGEIVSAFLIDAETDLFKTGYADANSEMAIGPNALDTVKNAFSSFVSGAQLDAGIQNLLYRICCTVDAAQEITAQLLDIEVKHSLGSGEMPVAIDVDPAFTTVRKFESVREAAEILLELTYELHKIIYPEDTRTNVGFEASYVYTRYRKLSELDGLTLGELDDRQLFDLDYVTLG